MTSLTAERLWTMNASRTYIQIQMCIYSNALEFMYALHIRCTIFEFSHIPTVSKNKIERKKEKNRKRNQWNAVPVCKKIFVWMKSNSSYVLNFRPCIHCDFRFFPVCQYQVAETLPGRAWTLHWVSSELSRLFQLRILLPDRRKSAVDISWMTSYCHISPEMIQHFEGSINCFSHFPCQPRLLYFQTSYPILPLCKLVTRSPKFSPVICLLSRVPAPPAGTLHWPTKEIKPKGGDSLARLLQDCWEDCLHPATVVLVI